MKLLVIFNPNAAAGRSNRLLPGIQGQLRAESIEAEFLFTGHAGHAAQLVAEADLSGFDGVVAAGGDGTVFEVVNGLFRRSGGDRVPLGVLPVGTGNAFARDLGLEPSAWRHGIEILARRRSQPVDVGQVTTASERFWFINIIGMGFAVDAGMTAKKLKFLGNAAYTMGTLWEVLKLASYPLVIEVDGRRVEQDNVMAVVSNSRYTGTRFLIAPEARFDDGLLDVTVVRKLSRARILRLFPTIYSGRHVDFEEVSTFKARHVRIEAPANMPLAPDGEFRGITPCEIECLQGGLQLFF